MSSETLGVICLGAAGLVVWGLVIFSRRPVSYNPKKPKGPPRDVPPPLEFRRRKR